MHLLDTCTFLWLTRDHPRLSLSARKTISAQAGNLYVSVVSGFEIAQKVAKGRLILPQPLPEWMQSSLSVRGIQALPLDMGSAMAAGALPPLHADPFDRLLIASAQTHRMTLLTPDPLIRQYPALATFW